MPIWQKQSRAGSPSSRKATNPKLLHNVTFQDSAASFDGRQDRSQFSGHVRTTDRRDLPNSSFEPRPQHVRSHSHPPISRSRPRTPPSQVARIHKGQRTAEQGTGKFGRGNNSNGLAESDLIQGRCATCNTLVRWPKQLDVFRCAVCLMVNDLGSSKAKEVNSGRAVSSISIESTRSIAVECIRRYITNVNTLYIRAAGRRHNEQPEDTSSAKITVPVTMGAFEDNEKLLDTVETSALIPRVFQRLEEYLMTCFSDVHCLNLSFTTANLAKSSESSKERLHQSARDFNSLDETSGISPEIDAKTLLIGDIAENGTWWTGRPSTTQALRSPTGTDTRFPKKTIRENVKVSSMSIDWFGLQQWYDFVYSLQDVVLKETERMKSHEVHPDVMQRVCKDLVRPCADIQDVLLKATETALRRPGHPITSPADCRFMLIILANPLFRSEYKLRSSQMQYGPVQNEVQRVLFSVSSKELRDSREPPGAVYSDGKQFPFPSVLKRVLGLIANVPSPLCHQSMVLCFSSLTRNSFSDIVELIGRFVSYRLSKKNRRTRRESHDPTSGGLIPSVSGSGSATAAQLHATIATSGGAKDRSPGSNTSYGDDWQIRAAARVILLLFTANNKRLLRREERPLLAARGLQATHVSRSLRHEPKVHSSAFYNSSVDSCDLLSDFETWESRRGKFCFCQYPMLLSLQAKISIMEHEAQRQMEIKAREAFFNSILGRKAISQYLVLKVRRDCLAEDSLRSISEVVGTGQEEIKKGLRIEFLGEEGLDSGGLRKEWFLLLVREVFDVNHGLFVYDEQSNFCYFNPHSFENSDQFFLSGVLLGLAIYNSTILDIALPPFAFRKLLASAPNHDGPVTHLSRPHHSSSLDDLAEYRPALAHGLRKLLDFEGDVEETFLQDFVAPIERFGQIERVPLCPDGAHRAVTAANRHEFVDLYVRYLLDRSIQRQFEPFKRGFFTVCGGNALSLFQAEEIELLVRGSDEMLDVSTLKAVAVHENWTTKNDPTTEAPLSWFWESFAEADPSHQRRLLSFITASDRIPAMGAASLVIKVTCLGDDVNRYPIARTCFNMIGLYNYHSKEELEKKLLSAVMESEGFGMR